MRAFVSPGFAGETSFEPAHVKVALKGRLEEIDNVVSNALTAFVDCAGASSGMVTNWPVSVHIPPGVDVKAVVEPAAVKVTVGRK